MGKATHQGAERREAGRACSRGLTLTAAALTGLLFNVPFAGDAAAQSKKTAKGGEAAAQEPGASVQRAYAAGTRAFDAGDMAGAERNLSVALAGGGLPNAQMARALYLRGSAYRQMGRPAQAISDLTTAIWLKGGLSAEDKAKATEARQLAYREAGLGDTPPPIGGAPLDQSPTTATAAAPAPAAGTQVVQVTQQSFWNGFSLPSLTGGSSQPVQASAAPAAATQTADGAQQSSFWSFLPSLTGGASAPSADAAAPSVADPAFATTVASAAAPDAGAPALGFAASAGPVPAAPSSWETQTASVQMAAVAAPQAVAAAPSAPEIAGLNPMPGASPTGASQGVSWSNPLAGTGEAVTGFFGGIFGGGSAAPQAASAEAAALTTGSTGASGGGAWGSETTVVTSQTSSMVQRGPDVPAAPSPAPGAAAEGELPWTTAGAPAAPARVAAVSQGGKYKLQVAAVRSRAEADKLAQSLQSYQAVRDGTVSTEIDEAVIGSMGTFYRVRLGPYASAKEPDQLCKTLRPQGFDCLVVTQ